MKKAGDYPYEIKTPATVMHSISSSAPELKTRQNRLKLDQLSNLEANLKILLQLQSQSTLPAEPEVVESLKTQVEKTEEQKQQFLHANQIDYNLAISSREAESAPLQSNSFPASLIQKTKMYNESFKTFQRNVDKQDLAIKKYVLNNRKASIKKKQLDIVAQQRNFSVEISPRIVLDQDGGIPKIRPPRIESIFATAAAPTEDSFSLQQGSRNTQESRMQATLDEKDTAKQNSTLFLDFNKHNSAGISTVYRKKQSTDASQTFADYVKQQASANMKDENMNTKSSSAMRIFQVETFDAISSHSHHSSTHELNDTPESKREKKPSTTLEASHLQEGSQTEPQHQPQVFISKAKRFPAPLDEAFTKQLQIPGPGHYNTSESPYSLPKQKNRLKQLQMNKFSQLEKMKKIKVIDPAKQKALGLFQNQLITTMASPRYKDQMSIKKIVKDMNQVTHEKKQQSKTAKGVLLAVQNKPWTLTRRRKEIEKRSSELKPFKSSLSPVDAESLELSSSRMEAGAAPEFVRLIEEKKKSKCEMAEKDGIEPKIDLIKKKAQHLSNIRFKPSCLPKASNLIQALSNNANRSATTIELVQPGSNKSFMSSRPTIPSIRSAVPLPAFSLYGDPGTTLSSTTLRKKSLDELKPINEDLDRSDLVHFLTKNLADHMEYQSGPAKIPAKNMRNHQRLVVNHTALGDKPTTLRKVHSLRPLPDSEARKGSSSNLCKSAFALPINPTNFRQGQIEKYVQVPPGQRQTPGLNLYNPDITKHLIVPSSSSAGSPKHRGSPGSLTPGLRTKLAPISKALIKQKRAPPVSPGLPPPKEQGDSALKLEFLCDSLKVQEIMNLEKYQPGDSCPSQPYQLPYLRRDSADNPVLTTQLSQTGKFEMPQQFVFAGTGKDMSSEEKSGDDKPPKFKAIVPKQLKIVRVIK